MIAFLSIAMLMALRTRTSSNGFFLRVERQIADIESRLLQDRDVRILPDRVEIGRIGYGITWHSSFWSLAQRTEASGVIA